VERKLATVLFVDLVASTDLVAAADPEVVRRRVTRFFDSVSSCVVTHGGIVEKFAGDAVMAAFGIPLAHEDDAERAVRAALAIAEKLRELDLEARIGIESGEVVAEDSESTFATGEAVNLAARLQQSARPGQILIGPTAAGLTRGLVECESLGPVQLRGFAEPVEICEVHAACEGGRPLGSLTAPLVGREEELELLENTFARTVRHRRASLFTLYGEPGVGKSRLAREFVAGLEGATVLSGRCLPYGEGVTYWPLAEMVKASAGIADDDPLEEAQEKLRACCEDEAVADLLALAAGVLEAVEGERSQQEIAWAARAWAEQLAEPQPLVLVFEDIHWAEEPLLELVEHLAAWVREAPLLLLCLARPELLDVRPTWGGGRLRATAIELEPLPRTDSRELAEALLAEHETGADVDVDAVLAKTEGNPLFVEETVRMLLERGGVLQQIPDTLQALIAARIDGLPPEQRTVLQRASVVGRIFWTGAVAHLAPELDDPEHALDQLLLRDFVTRESRSSIKGEDAYKFKHVLIREVAYAGLSKEARSAHHARFAAWLAEHVGEELLEIRAFHLDQAARLHAELDGAVPPELAEEAATALSRAGDRAASREAFRTTRNLYLRAGELAPTLERRYSAARAAWRLGDYTAVEVEMALVRDEAEHVNPRLEGRALTALAEVHLYHEADAEQARDLVDRALAVLPEGDTARFDALFLRAEIAAQAGAHEEFEQFGEEALCVARAAERKDLESLAAQALAHNLLARLKPARAEPLIERALELADESGSVFGRAAALRTVGWLDQTHGRIEESEAAYRQARDLYAEVGARALEAACDVWLGFLAFLRGAAAEAEPQLREAVRILSGVRDRARLCEAQRLLAQVLVARGGLDEAERLALTARETVGPQDRFSISTTTLALGVVRAAQGRDAEAETLLREAVAGFEAYGLAWAEREALPVLVGFLRDRGRDDVAEPYDERLAELTARTSARIA
jgi:class 3 adenylate cyclase/tetratricopeptide (TPR) repeat protein